MSRNKVVWCEGTLLEPQHFQQQERALEHRISLGLSAVKDNVWGFDSLQIDESALLNGVVMIDQASGVFDDGTPFSMPGSDPSALPLDVRNIQTGDRLCLVCTRDVLSRNVDMTGSHRESRFKAVDLEVPDINFLSTVETEQRVATMQVASLQTRIIPERLVTGAHVAVPMAKVRSIAGSKITLEEFVPPMLNFKGSHVLTGYAKELLRLIELRLEQIGVRGSRWSMDVAALIEMKLLSELSEAKLLLNCLLNRTLTHPQELYEYFVSLSGRLAFVPGNEQVYENSFLYKHESVDEGFRAVCSVLRHALSLVIESQIIPLSFEFRNGVYIHENDPHVEIEQIIFSVTCSLPAASLMKHFPTQAKLGPVEKISELIDLQLPGARFELLTTPPRHIPYYPESTYFHIDGGDEMWLAAKSGAAIALSLVGDFPQLQFEAWGVRAGRAV